MKELADLLEEERRLFEKLRSNIENQKIAMINRDLDAMGEALAKTERISLEIEELDRKRSEIFELLKIKFGLGKGAGLDELVSRLEGEDREIMLDALSRFLKTLNDLAVELEGLREMLGFENAYLEFLMSMMGGGSRGVYSSDGSYSEARSGGSLDARW